MSDEKRLTDAELLQLDAEVTHDLELATRIFTGAMAKAKRLQAELARRGDDEATAHPVRPASPLGRSEHPYPPGPPEEDDQ